MAQNRTSGLWERCNIPSDGFAGQPTYRTRNRHHGNGVCPLGLPLGLPRRRRLRIDRCSAVSSRVGLASTHMSRRLPHPLKRRSRSGRPALTYAARAPERVCPALCAESQAAVGNRPMHLDTSRRYWSLAAGFNGLDVDGFVRCSRRGERLRELQASSGQVTGIDHAANGLLMRTPRISCPSFKSSVYSTAAPARAAATTTSASQKESFAWSANPAAARIAA